MKTILFMVYWKEMATESMKNATSIRDKAILSKHTYILGSVAAYVSNIMALFCKYGDLRYDRGFVT